MVQGPSMRTSMAGALVLNRSRWYPFNQIYHRVRSSGAPDSGQSHSEDVRGVGGVLERNFPMRQVFLRSLQLFRLGSSKMTISEYLFEIDLSSSSDFCKAFGGLPMLFLKSSFHLSRRLRFFLWARFLLSAVSGRLILHHRGFIQPLTSSLELYMFSKKIFLFFFI